jgi:opacity protein-like surface antigen
VERHLTRGSALAVAALILLATSTTSHAADLAFKAPTLEPAQVWNWTGLYAGVGIGYHAGDITQAGCVGICPDGAELNKAFGAVTVGYDWQFANNVVLGAYAIVPFTRIDKTFDLAGFLFPQKTHFATNVSARLGVTFGNWMPYLSAGVTYADVSIHNNFTNITDSNDHFGPSVGVGVEYRVSQHFSIDGKYFYTHLPKKTYDLGGGPEQFGEDSSNLLLTANYRF